MTLARETVELLTGFLEVNLTSAEVALAAGKKLPAQSQRVQLLQKQRDEAARHLANWHQWKGSGGEGKHVP